LARVPITVMGFHCDRCGHEWIPRGGMDEEPRVCPSCHSVFWNQPDKKPRMTYEAFRDKIAAVLRESGKPLTWTEVRTKANLPQAFPNNQWVHRMETDIALVRQRESDGIIHWSLKDPSLDLGTAAAAQVANKIGARARAK
jgi:predicted Zn-ribbon and HTH transcriptional regulator